MTENDDRNAAKNRARFLRRSTNSNLQECEHLISEKLKALLSEAPGDLSKDQRELLPTLIDSLMKLRDRALADLWSVRLSDAIRVNPRIVAEVRGMPSLSKVGGAGARVMKAGSSDRREQAEKRRLEAGRKQWERDQRLAPTLPGSSPPAPKPSSLPFYKDPASPPKRGDSDLDDLLRDVDLPPQ
jgi:hypothetical protein